MLRGSTGDWTDKPDNRQPAGQVRRKGGRHAMDGFVSGFQQHHPTQHLPKGRQAPSMPPNTSRECVPHWCVNNHRAKNFHFFRQKPSRACCLDGTTAQACLQWISNADAVPHPLTNMDIHGSNSSCHPFPVFRRSTDQAMTHGMIAGS